MAWNIKYRTEFKAESNKLYYLDILEEDWAGGATIIQSGSEPITIESGYGDLNETIVGSGATIELMSTTSLQLTNLYTDAMFKYKVELKTSTYTQWTGWLNSDTYEEVYSEDNNYLVTFTANDGLAMLNELDYVDSNGDNYESIESAFDIIQRLLGKVSAFPVFHIGNSMTLLDDGDNALTPSTNETFLHVLQLNNDNYYDEYDKPLTCREVLDSILKSLGLLMRTNCMLYNQTSDSLIGYTIYDNNILLTGSDEIFYSYYTDTGVYKSFWTLGDSYFRYDLENDREYTGTGSTLKFKEVINNQQITFSPYNIVDVLKADLEEEDFCGYGAGCANYTGETLHNTCTEENKWSEWHYATNPDFETISTDAKITQEVYGIANDTVIVEPGKDYYVRTNTTAGSASNIRFKTIVDTKNLWGYHNTANSDFSSWALLINFKVMVQQKVCWGDASNALPPYYIGVKVDVGTSTVTKDAIISAGYYGNHYWQPSPAEKLLEADKYFSPSTNAADEEPNQDGMLVKLSAEDLSQVFVNGQVTISITEDSDVIVGGYGLFRFKDFTATLVQDTSNSAEEQSYYDTFTDDSVLESVVNTNARNDGSDITLIHGTHTNPRCLERGVMMYEDSVVSQAYHYLWKIDKGLLDDGSQPLYFSAEEWILNKILSNYKQPMIELSDIKIKALGLNSNVTARFTDINHFPDKIMMPTSYSYNVYEDSINFTLTEIESDNMDVIIN